MKYNNLIFNFRLFPGKSYDKISQKMQTNPKKESPFWGKIECPLKFYSYQLFSFVQNIENNEPISSNTNFGTHDNMEGQA